ncbi:MAG: tRNA 2-thiouridine(34) synthase MnmA [Deltaproteobacteria bacterium]|nr:MAG: tRNA 2-thiouridine(34) synthase MnmA [Deltaproteobacteria bacterium]
MSGGVDSSVAAALMQEAGWEVAGVTLRLADDPAAVEATGGRSCCAPDDLRDARRVAQILDIPHYVANYAAHFEAAVITPFARAYAAGRTPNPCVECNRRVKFDPLLRRARQIGASKLVTGHYARIARGEDGRWRLLRGVDREKDQSYFLYMLGQETLPALHFPLGALTKDAVRAVARRAGLPTAEKPESQEICFVGPRRRYAEVVEARVGAPEGGDLVHIDGRRLGTHAGVHRYTVGQRRGLGIAAGEPLYVVELRAASREVVVGPRKALERRHLRLSEVSWVLGEAPLDRPATVQIRYRHSGAPGRVVEAWERGCLVELDEPVRGAAPGQAVVLYDGEEVLGGGTLEEATA